MIAQAIGLLAGVPFIFMTGWTLSVPVLIAAMAGFGYFKGLYDANIWASLHDVVAVERRATGVGLMNAVGWIGGGFAAGRDRHRRGALRHERRDQRRLRRLPRRRRAAPVRVTVRFMRPSHA